jgi:hypothetical protein
MPTPGLSRWTFALIGFILGTLFGLALAGGAYVAVSRALRPAPPASPPNPVFAREEFTRRVMGKTEDEVISAVGRPDETSDDNDARYWHFKKRTRDPLTQAEDTDVQVVIKQGKVANVNY